MTFKKSTKKQCKTYNPNEIILNSESLFWVQKLLDLDAEACGILVPNYNTFQLVLDAYGEDDGSGRKMCLFKRYSDYIWHTHPRSVQGYPSAEDIAKTLKHADIRMQLIFTSWGTWQLSCANHREIDDSVRDEISKIGDWLYQVSERGRTLPSKEIVNQYIKFLTDYLQHFGFHIELIRYDR